MRKKYIGAVFILASILMLSSFVVAIKPNGPAAANGLSHPGKTSQLDLYEKDNAWNPVDGGAWGKLIFGDNFVFNGHGLNPATDYTLIRYADPWPGTPLTCLASGTSNNGGNINLGGEFSDGGSKVWLVLTDDVDCNTGMSAWNPGEYLFEYSTI